MKNIATRGGNSSRFCASTGDRDIGKHRRAAARKAAKVKHHSGGAA